MLHDSADTITAALQLACFPNIDPSALSSWSRETAVHPDMLTCTEAYIPSNSQSQNQISRVQIGKRMLISVSSGVSVKLSNLACYRWVTALSACKDGEAAWVIPIPYVLCQQKRT